MGFSGNFSLLVRFGGTYASVQLLPQVLQFSWYDPQTLLDDDDFGPALDSPGLAELLREHLLEPDAARCS